MNTDLLIDVGLSPRSIVYHSRIRYRYDHISSVLINHGGHGVICLDIVLYLRLFIDERFFFCKRVHHVIQTPLEFSTLRNLEMIKYSLLQVYPNLLSVDLSVLSTIIYIYIYIYIYIFNWYSQLSFFAFLLFFLCLQLKSEI